MPAFTNQFIDGVPADGKWYRDTGGRNSVNGLLLYAGKRAKVYYVEVSRGSKVKIGNTSAYTLKKARTEAKRKLGKAADGHDYRAERRYRKGLMSTTLGGYLDGTYKAHAETHIASHRPMLAGLRTHFSHVLDKPMGEITEFDLAKWRKRRSNVTVATQRRELANLKAVLNHAVRQKVIQEHQIGSYRVTGTLKDRQNKAKLRYLSDTEEMRLRAALDVREERIKQERVRANEWRTARGYATKPEIGLNQYADYLKPLVLVALNTGLRRGDLLGLSWEEVDLRKRQICKVIEKTSHAVRKAGRDPVPAILPLSAEAFAVFSQLRTQRREGSDLVFVSPVTGNRLTSVKRAFEGVLRDARIDHFRFHDLRHTFASRLVMAGVDINTVRELMTHADIKMTLIYAHLSPDHKAAALEKAFGNA